MTITIRGQILAALRNNPGLNSARIASMIGMTTKKISGPLSTLFADGLIEFEGKHGQRLYRLTSYGMKYAPQTIPAMPKGNSNLVQRTEANVICQECRNSAAMKRVLMVWGGGRGMTRIRNFGWNRLKLATLSYDELNQLEEQVKLEHACKDGIHMYDKAGRDKLDALSWAVYNKQKQEAAQ